MATGKKYPVPNSRTKPCPDLRKGVRCPLCGSSYTCAQSWRPKAGAKKPAPVGGEG